MNKRDLIKAMINCDQIPNKQNILEHGISVMRSFNHIRNYMEKDIIPPFELPSWLIEYKEQIKPLLFSKYLMNKYLVFHDCGKPFCANKNEYG